MKKPLNSRADVEQLVNLFYDRVKADELIGPIFQDIARVNWNKHLPIMYDFWSSILLDEDVYHRNAMIPHLDLNKRFPLQETHFQRWLQLFDETVNTYFEGEKAALAKFRAHSIAGVMQTKLGLLKQIQSTNKRP
ncbi:MAG: group III truncated hemoglobin [Thermoflavifilum sp.]|nr:group III truncated hemoglobin [Thermoflavifilum sp.]